MERLFWILVSRDLKKFKKVLRGPYKENKFCILDKTCSSWQPPARTACHETCSSWQPHLLAWMMDLKEYMGEKRLIIGLIFFFFG
jgi:hypothetical protein